MKGKSPEVELSHAGTSCMSAGHVSASYQRIFWPSSMPLTLKHTIPVGGRVKTGPEFSTLFSSVNRDS